MSLYDAYKAATLKTAANLKTIAASPQVVQLSRLSLPEIEAMTQEIARVVPAGNIPGLILSGLARLENRMVAPLDQQRHIALLIRGIRNGLDMAVYSSMFAGPAAVILAYQKLLRLAGKDVDSAFPEGTWQYYLEYALREDSAHHATETIGFQQRLRKKGIALNHADTIAAWVIAAQVMIYSYKHLLENEWRERVYLRLLEQVTTGDQGASGFSSAYQQWEQERPYSRSEHEDYTTYRRAKFDRYLDKLLAQVPAPARAAFQQAVQEATTNSLPAFVRQMHILAALEPDEYHEQRVPYSIGEAQIGVIYRGHYYLIPVVSPNRATLVDAQTVRSHINALMRAAPAATGSQIDLMLANASREAQANLRKKVRNAESLKALAHVPIILNADWRDAHLPLMALRHGQRGVGDHALTLFFTDESTIFDQSHIFFDGNWGATFADIMTNEAFAWGVHLSQSAVTTIPHAAIKPLPPITATPEVHHAAAQAGLSPEAYAESSALRLEPVLDLRRFFRARNEIVSLTVNDLLVLHRSLHNQRYTPSSALIGSLEQLKAEATARSRKRTSATPAQENLVEAYNAVIHLLERTPHTNPALLIPIDASQASPNERVYPTTFRNPMSTLLQEHDATLARLRTFERARNKTAAYKAFHDQRLSYLRMIASFGALLFRYKQIALSGRSTSTASIKLLAHMPKAIQRLLDEIPGQFDLLNEIIKGEEVFSNIGHVPAGSSIRRFMTAKDDNPHKSLAWGIVTDAQDIVHISLRDFRPHVARLWQIGKPELANLITKDFLDSYVDGFNLFVRELRQITVARQDAER
jgi:hypothetical protein